VPAFAAGFGVGPGRVPKAICGMSDGDGVAAAIRSELGAGGGAVSALVSLPTNGVSSASWVPANGPSDDAAAFVAPGARTIYNCDGPSGTLSTWR
jgi:hypothetical protein